MERGSFPAWSIGLLHEAHAVVAHKFCDKVWMGLVKMNADNSSYEFTPVLDELIVP
jgi:hypothetical protein